MMYLLAPEQHAQIVDALESVYGKGKRCEGALAMLKAMQPVSCPPPECQTEAEKTAYAFGWWKAQNGGVE
jgi:hypothetical protein